MPHEPLDGAVTDPESDLPAKRYPKGIRRRREILDRTIDVLAELGFEGTSLRAIGDAIGVSHGALRRYFPTREELFLEVLREKDRQALSEAQDRHGGLLGFADNLDEYSSRTPGLMALRHSMVGRALEYENEHSRSFFVERYRSLRAQAEEILTIAKEAGVLRRDIPVDVAASLAIAAMDGLSTQWLLDPEVSMHDGLILFEALLLQEPVGA